MTRYFLELSYVGKNYHGWQYQPNALSIQEVIEHTISKILREKIKLTGAGRTDTGVHAKQTFAHFDSSAVLEVSKIRYQLNAFLPKDIAIHNLCQVTDNAHARFDATERTYEYWIHTVKTPFLIDYSYYLSRNLDIEKMNSASKILLKHEDFECFSKKNSDVKTSICNLSDAFWKWRSGVLVFTITADRFLRNMVRAIVGTLLDIGLLKLSSDDMIRILESKKRENAGASVPAHGLYLTRVIYPTHIFKNNDYREKKCV